MIKKIYCIIILFMLFNLSTTREKPILLVICIPGFRLDFLDLNLTSDLNKFKNDGKFISKITDLYPTYYLSSEYTMASGLYPEEHGLIRDKVYDRELGKVIKYSEKEEYPFHKSFIPIFVSNELKNGVSACIGWWGCAPTYNGSKVTYYKNGDNIQYDSGIKLALEWVLKPEKPANFILMSFQNLLFKIYNGGGITSESVMKEIAAINNAMKYLFEQLDQHGLKKSTNVIFMSSYGMADILPENVIDIRPILGNVTNLRRGAYTQIVAGKEVYDALKANETAYNVYNMTTIPKRWHCNSTRFGPIALVSKPGFGFVDHRFNAVDGLDTADDDRLFGFIIADGPGMEGLPINITVVDVYHLFKKVLQIDKPTKKPIFLSLEAIVTLVILLILLIEVIVIVVLRKYSHSEEDTEMWFRA